MKTITFPLKLQIARPEVGGIDLRVSASSKDGKPLQSSDLVQDASPLETIDLVTPMVEKPVGEQRIEGAIMLEHGEPASSPKLRLWILHDSSV